MTNALMPEFKDQMDDAHAKAISSVASLTPEEAAILRAAIEHKVQVLSQGMTGDPQSIESYCRDRAWESVDLEAYFPEVVGALKQQHAGYRRLVEESGRGRGYASVLMRKANRARPEIESLDELLRQTKSRIRGEIGQ